MTLSASKIKDLVMGGTRMALASALVASAVMIGSIGSAERAYADEAAPAHSQVVPIAATLVDQTYDDEGVRVNGNPSIRPIGEGMASQLVRFNEEIISALPTQGDAIVSLAEKQLGVPYVYGGTTPRGFDCSGFTQYVYRNALGIELPRSAAAQYGMGESVAFSDLQAGDLLFWGSGKGIYHVGIYIGDGNYIHAGASAHSICIQSMSAYKPTSAKRLI